MVWCGVVWDGVRVCVCVWREEKGQGKRSWRGWEREKGLGEKRREGEGERCEGEEWRRSGWQTWNDELNWIRESNTTHAQGERGKAQPTRRIGAGKQHHSGTKRAR